MQCVYTNTLPTGPYRGAGRPEANYVIERLVEEAARVTGIDRVAIRKRNFIPSSAMPYKTAISTTFDSGEFPAVFDKAMALADMPDSRSASANSEGAANCAVSAFPAFSSIPAVCRPKARSLPSRRRKRWWSPWACNTGQGHATVYPRLVAEKLGICRRR